MVIVPEFLSPRAPRSQEASKLDADLQKGERTIVYIQIRSAEKLCCLSFFEWVGD